MRQCRPNPDDNTPTSILLTALTNDHPQQHQTSRHSRHRRRPWRGIDILPLQQKILILIGGCLHSGPSFTNFNSRTSFISQDPEYDIGTPAATTSNNTTVLMPHSHEERMQRRVAARMAVEEENSESRQSITVRVPVSLANCRPRYDCIGPAKDLWTEVTVSRADDKFEITAEGDGAAKMPKDASNLLVTGVKAAYDTAEKPMPPLKYHVVSRILFARGLGSPRAAIVAGGIIAGLVLAGHRLPVWGSESLAKIAATIEVEGHPDNVAPVIYRGFQIGIHNGTRWVTERVPCPPGTQLVMFIHNFIGKPSAARGVLSDTISSIKNGRPGQNAPVPALRGNVSTFIYHDQGGRGCGSMLRLPQWCGTYR
ncbi:hypothetical protein ACHAXR_004017 [Thalassiosira sp. AJA248-18]